MRRAGVMTRWMDADVRMVDHVPQEPAELLRQVRRGHAVAQVRLVAPRRRLLEERDLALARLLERDALCELLRRGLLRHVVSIYRKVSLKLTGRKWLVHLSVWLAPSSTLSHASSSPCWIRSGLVRTPEERSPGCRDVGSSTTYQLYEVPFRLPRAPRTQLLGCRCRLMHIMCILFRQSVVAIP